MPFGPASGEQGKRGNLELVERARKAVGPEGELMCDCWMSWDEPYTIEMCRLMEPYRVKWLEEVLPPYDFEGFGRLSRKITSTSSPTASMSMAATVSGGCWRRTAPPSGSPMSPGAAA